MSRRNRFPLAAVTSVALLLLAGTAWARMSPREIYKTKAPGVVLIVAAQEGSSSASAGTGSIIDGRGLVVTNAHVIYDPTTKAPYPVVHVFLKPDKITGDMNKDLTRHHVGKVLAYDVELDLALLEMQSPPGDITVITLGDPDEIGPGDETIAIGHPEQGGLWTITTGVIGAEFQDFKGVSGKDVFQMETSLNRGNSGGPLFDVRGYQVGVNTAIARKGEGGVAITGVNFAVKASVVKRWASKHKVALAYGSERVDAPAADTRVAAAEPARTEPARTEPARPEPARTEPARTEPAANEVRDPEGKGSIRVEPDDEGADTETVSRPADRHPGKTEPARVQPNKVARRKPVRFQSHYRLPPRPYTYKKLFTAVDAVRARADEAFDDLEREVHRRGH